MPSEGRSPQPRSNHAVSKIRDYWQTPVDISCILWANLRLNLSSQKTSNTPFLFWLDFVNFKLNFKGVEGFLPVNLRCTCSWTTLFSSAGPWIGGRLGRVPIGQSTSQIERKQIRANRHVLYRFSLVRGGSWTRDRPLFRRPIIQ